MEFYNYILEIPLMMGYWFKISVFFFFELEKDSACKFALFKIFISKPVLLKL